MPKVPVLLDALNPLVKPDVRVVSPVGQVGGPRTLSVLAGVIHDAVDKPLNEWASQPEFAKGNTIVSVEVKDDR